MFFILTLTAVKYNIICKTKTLYVSFRTKNAPELICFVSETLEK